MALTVLVIVLATAFINLGGWQARRLEERRASNALIVAHENAPIVPAAAVFTRPITDADEWQRVTVTGVYDAAHQYQVRYRSNRGQPGQEVVTPLRAADGRVYLVDRGFIARPKGEGLLETLPPPPTGTVTVVGHVRRDEMGPEVARVPSQGRIRLIDSQAIATDLGHPVVAGYIGLLTSEPEQEGGLVPVALPVLDEGPHFWYAVQWYMFTGFAVVGWFVMIGRDVIALRATPRPPTPGKDD